MKKDTEERIRRELDAHAIGKHYNFKVPNRDQGNISSPLVPGGDKDPSFSIDQKKNLWKCHSTGIGGDWLRFIAIMENWDARTDFPKILEFAADILNIPEEDRVNDDEFKRKPTSSASYIKAWDRIANTPDDVIEAAILDYRKRKGIDMRKPCFSEIEWRVDSSPEYGAFVVIKMFDENKRFCGLQRSVKRVYGGSKLGMFRPKNIDKSKTLWVVEGMSDFLSMLQMGHTNTIGLASTNTPIPVILSQIEGAKDVNLILDSDSESKTPGGTPSFAGLRTAIKINLKNKNAKIFRLNGPGWEDVNDKLVNGVKDISKICNRITHQMAIETIPQEAKADAAYIARRILERFQFCHVAGGFWQYIETTWQEVENSDVEAIIQEYLEEDLEIRHSKKKIKEVAYYIDINSRKQSQEFAKQLQIQEIVLKPYVYMSDGKWNFLTEEIEDYAPEDYVIKTLDISARATYRTPKTFLKFLNEIFDGKPNPEEYIRLIQQWSGYMLYPAYPKAFEKLLVLEGAGGNGKGTLINCWCDILGGGNYSAMGIDDMNDKFMRGNLVGKYANFVTDTDDRPDITKSIVKTLTGGDHITVDRKYKNPINIKPFCKLTIATNDTPSIGDGGNWLQRRLMYIKMDNVFAGLNKSGSMDLEKGLRQDREGIFWWAMEGLKDMYKNGFVLPNQMKEDVMSLINTNDSARLWLHAQEQERIVGLETLAARSMKDAYMDFRDFCEKELNRSTRYIMNRQTFEKRFDTGGILIGKARYYKEGIYLRRESLNDI